MKTKPKPKKKPVVLAPLPIGTILLSLDVSSSAMGWAVGKRTKDGVEVLGFGVEKPPAGWDFQRRVFRMMTTADWLIDEYGVHRSCCEWQDHRSTSMRVQGLAVLGQAQGAVWNHLISKMEVDRVPVRDATKLNGKNVKKETRREYVKSVIPAYAAELEANPKFDPGADASDACCLLLYRMAL